MKQGQKTRSIPLSISVRKVDEANLRITHTINTKTLDRYGTVVLPKGVDAEKFKQNAVVLWLHNSDETLPKIPIGRCVELDVREDEIVVTTEFNRNDPLAVKVFQAYKDGFLHAWSIGFIPQRFTEITPANQEELNKQYGLNLKLTEEDFAANSWWGLWVIHKWELLEYSAVPVPGNPDALSYDAEEAEFTRELVTRGLVEEDEVRRINFRELLKKQEKREEGEAASGEEQAEANAEAAPAENTSEEAPAEAPAEEAAPAETPAEETPAEESAEAAPAEEAPAEEAPAAEEEAPAAESETPSEEAATEEAPAEETPAEEAAPTEEAPAEEAPAEAEAPTESTDEAPAASEAPVAEAQPSETEAAAQAQIVELTQKNAELSERLAQLEKKLSEVEANLDVDNINKIRAVAQKKLNSNPETFFSRLLKG